MSGELLLYYGLDYQNGLSLFPCQGLNKIKRDWAGGQDWWYGLPCGFRDGVCHTICCRGLERTAEGGEAFLIEDNNLWGPLKMGIRRAFTTDNPAHPASSL